MSRRRRLRPLALSLALLATPRISAATPPAPGDASVPPPAFAGSVPLADDETTTPLELSLAEAIRRGLAQNLGALLAESDVEAARGRRWQDLADLLPKLSGRAERARQEINLAAFGFPVPKDQSPVVGPFDLVDARLSLDAPIFDWSAIERARAGRARLEAARGTRDDARDLVALVVTDLYFGTLARQADVEAARADLATAEALFELATDRRRAGAVADVAVLRANVEQERERQNLIAAETDLAKTRLALARAIGAPLARPLELTDGLGFEELAPPSLERALERALGARGDIRAAEARVAAAKAEHEAAAAERWPAIAGHADYGTIGPSLGSAESTFTLRALLEVPLFAGGRIHGKVLAADAALGRARDELASLRGRVELEVRSALLDLDAARRQVEVARTEVTLAERQLEQARDRFGAGVASNLEVVEAQQMMADAHARRTASLFAYNVAKGTLARALGVSEDEAARFLNLSGGRSER